MSTSAESFQVLPSFEGFLKNTTWPVLTFFIVACTLNYSFITSAETRLGDDFKSLRDDVKSLRDDVKSVENKLDGKMDTIRSEISSIQFVLGQVVNQLRIGQPTSSQKQEGDS